MRKYLYLILTFYIFSGLWFCKQQKLGLFEKNADIGQCKLKGSVKYNHEKGEYILSGSGENMWFTEDAFHFVWSETSGDLKLSSKIVFLGEGQHEHRKAGLIVRQSLEPDAVYIDAIIHGDGLTSMQYRNEKDDSTYQIVSPDSGLPYIQIERIRDQFIFSVSEDGQDFKTVGEYTLKLNDPVYTGLGICSHDSTTIETAVFSNLQFIYQK
jgi:TolB protein